jgi:PIN domain nuclease of toxin-antitoxin system
VIVLDASALLAFLFGETGHERIAAQLGSSCISTVNLSEVIGRFTRDGHDAREVLQQIGQSTIETVPFLAEDAALAAALVPATLPLGLSLGDRACLALAASRRVAAWTADRAWASLDIGLKIEVVR